MQWFARLGALGLGLLIATPISAQTTEPPARTAAAFADYHKVCAVFIAPDIEFYANHPDARFRQSLVEATRGVDYIFREIRDGSNSTSAPDRYGLTALEGLRQRVLTRTGEEERYHNAPHRLAKCAAEVALRHGLQGVPGYDYGVASKAPPAAVAPPKPAPVAVAEKLPKARPAKEQPWSPKSMSTDASKKLDPKYTAERVDILASCVASMREIAKARGDGFEETNLGNEQEFLSDEKMNKTASEMRAEVARIDAQISSGKYDAGWLTAFRNFRCTDERRIAQLEGSPLIAGAVDGSLTPLSIGGSNLPGPPGKDAHIIASNGKSAMDCVKLEQGPTGDGLLGTGGRVLVNRCSDSVAIGWCYSPGDCSNESGSSWNVPAGHVWPVKAAGEIRWSACHGANTQSFVRGSHGLRYYCSAPK